MRERRLQTCLMLVLFVAATVPTVVVGMMTVSLALVLGCSTFLFTLPVAAAEA